MDQRKFIGAIGVSLIAARLVADERPVDENTTQRLSVPHLFLAKFVVPLAGRMGMESCVILPQDTQVIKNLERKASSASSPIDEQFIEVGTQGFDVRPPRGGSIGDARVQFAERVRLDSTRQSVKPFLGVQQKECDRQRLTLPHELERTFRSGWLVPVDPVSGVSYRIHQPGVLAVDRRWSSHRFGGSQRRCLQ
jgi:hypothetical protein